MSIKRTASGTIAVLVAATALSLGVATTASAACGFSASDYLSGVQAQSYVDKASNCSRQNSKAKYYITGSNYTYTSYGPDGISYNGDWWAHSPSVPSGKTTAGSGTSLEFLGNPTVWYATH